MKSAFLVVLTFIKITWVPDIELITWVIIAIGVDFITGIIKAYLQREARTSSGFRRTVVKFLQYGGAIVIGIILTNAIADKDSNPQAMLLVDFFHSGLLIGLLYIEATSICENIYAVDQKSMFAKYFIWPLLCLLTFQIRNNPLNKNTPKQDETP